jgi:hypothetical protein
MRGRTILRTSLPNCFPCLKLAAALALLATAAAAQAKSLGGSAGSRFGIVLAPSSLGIGLQFAARVSKSSNIRVGFNDFSYGRSLSSDGLRYAGQLTLRSVQATYDWYVWGNLHLSPGVLVYNDNHATATVTAPPGQQFSLGGATYTSSSTNPVTGNGNLTLGRAAPLLLIGLGNPVSRGSGHFGMELDAGVAFEGSPNVVLNLGGTACDSTGTVCAPVASFPGLQNNVQAEQAKLNHDLNPLRFYPIVAVGLSYSF